MKSIVCASLQYEQTDINTYCVRNNPEKNRRYFIEVPRSLASL